jgi:hypothetical protein
MGLVGGGIIPEREWAEGCECEPCKRAREQAERRKLIESIQGDLWGLTIEQLQTVRDLMAVGDGWQRQVCAKCGTENEFNIYTVCVLDCGKCGEPLTEGPPRE